MNKAGGVGEGEPWLLLAVFGHTSITLYLIVNLLIYSIQMICTEKRRDVIVVMSVCVRTGCFPRSRLSPYTEHHGAYIPSPGLQARRTRYSAHGASCRWLVLPARQSSQGKAQEHIQHHNHPVPAQVTTTSRIKLRGLRLSHLT